MKYERKLAERDKRPPNRRGKPPKAPSDKAKDDKQVKLTDRDSGLMKKNESSEWRQSSNAQAVVDAEGSQLVLGARVSRCANDSEELVAEVDSVPESVGSVERALADNCFATGSEVKALFDRGIDVLVSTRKEDRRRQHDPRRRRNLKRSRSRSGSWRCGRSWPKTRIAPGTAYASRPWNGVLGVVKNVMGFRQPSTQRRPGIAYQQSERTPRGTAQPNVSRLLTTLNRPSTGAKSPLPVWRSPSWGM